MSDPLYRPLSTHQLTQYVTRKFTHGQTYQAHPMVCAGALEVQRIIQAEDLVANAARMGMVLEKQLKETFSTHPNVGNIRGRGLFWGVSQDPMHTCSMLPSP